MCVCLCLCVSVWVCVCVFVLRPLAVHVAASKPLESFLERRGGESNCVVRTPNLSCERYTLLKEVSLKCIQVARSVKS